MQIKLSIYLLFLPLVSVAQQLSFDFDNAGNQVKREITFTAGKFGKPAGVKEDPAVIKEFLNFVPNENLSYYPNPVSENLHLKWNVAEDSKVIQIQVSSANGQIIKNQDNIDSGSHIMAFSEFPTGIYFVNLLYSTGETKTIKIIKK